MTIATFNDDNGNEKFRIISRFILIPIQLAGKWKYFGTVYIKQYKLNISDSESVWEDLEFIDNISTLNSEHLRNIEFKLD